MVENKQMHNIIEKVLEEILSLKVINYSVIIKEKKAAKNELIKEQDDLSKKVRIIFENNKEKDIIRIIDENNDNITDKIKDDFLQIAVKMDGFDKVFLEQYQKMLDSYKRFLNEYLSNTANSVFKINYGYETNNKNKKEFQWGDDVVSNLEMFDVARKIMMNSLMGGAGLVSANAGNNTTSNYQREDYEMWKNSSKFNMLLSFLLYEKSMNGG